MQPVELTHRVSCSSSRAEIWARISDTERLNRFVGNQPLNVERVEDHSSPARYLTTTKLGPTLVHYLEKPYEWAEARYWRMHRDLDRGPARSIALSFELHDEGEGCVVDVTMRLVPRFALLAPLVRLFAGRGFQHIVGYVAAADAAAHEGRRVETPAVHVDRAAAERAGEALASKYPAELCKRLVEHVITADDVELRRIRPFELADDWGADRERVLRLCLDAVAMGLLELQWSILCPSCRGAADTLPSLDGLGNEAHCHACDIRYEVELDRVVEATFSPHPRVRTIEDRPFCIGGPALVPHVVAQALLLPGQTTKLDVPAEPGRYRLFVRGGKTALCEVTPDAPASVEIVPTDDGLSPARVEVAPSGMLSVVGALDEPAHIKLERTEWNQRAATALVVSTLPEFRAQFGREALRPGLALKVGRIAILFSDLCASTALYSRLGDAAAFGVVTDCLTYGRLVVERHGGTVVKTMGDAIMAAFAEPERAVAAAAESLAGWTEFQRIHPNASELDLKIGVFAGPSTIVTANGVLDYFGQTVNTAARLQAQAEARELVVHQALLEEIGALPTELSVFERFTARVKGIPEPLPLVRLGLASLQVRAPGLV